MRMVYSSVPEENQGGLSAEEKNEQILPHLPKVKKHLI
jgi:hypothetical protein